MENIQEQAQEEFKEIYKIVAKDIELAMLKWSKLELRPMSSLLCALEEICIYLKCIEVDSCDFCLEELLKIALIKAEIGCKKKKVK
jgi:hypothetical protein